MHYFFAHAGNFRGVFGGKEGFSEDRKPSKTPRKTLFLATSDPAPELQARGEYFTGH
jgi:hypothetical protein